jgi:hypothetical protein
VKVLKMAVAVNARHPASPLAKQAAVLQINSAKIKKRTNKNRRLKGRLFLRRKYDTSV